MTIWTWSTVKGVVLVFLACWLLAWAVILFIVWRHRHGAMRPAWIAVLDYWPGLVRQIRRAGWRTHLMVLGVYVVLVIFLFLQWRP